MISEAKFFGDAEFAVKSGNWTLNWRKRFHTYGTTSAGFDCTLPKTSDYCCTGLMGPTLCIVNVGSNSFNIKKSDGTLIVALAADKAAILSPITIAAPGAWHYLQLTDLD